MKHIYKVAGSLVVGLSMLAVASAAFADVDCSVTPTAPSCIYQNGDPSAVTNAWGLSGYQTPHIAAGTSITDGFGLVSYCPAFYLNPFNPGQDCMDISHTPYYIAGMEAAGFTLK